MVINLKTVLRMRILARYSHRTFPDWQLLKLLAFAQHFNQCQKKIITEKPLRKFITYYTT